MSSYGAFPDSLAVGAVADVVDFNSLATVPYPSFTGGFTTGHNASAATVDISGSVPVLLRMVDIATTGIADLVSDFSTVGSISGIAGTSFSAPQVAGAAGVLKDWAYSTGGLTEAYRNDPYVLRTMISAMGDGGASTSSGGGGVESTTGIDRGLGFGHLRFTVPSFLGSSAYSHSRVLAYPDTAQGDIIEWYIGQDSGAEPSQIQGWKFAAHMDHDWYSSSPVINFSLIDKCPAGGGTAVIRTAIRFAHKARIRMSAGDMATQYRGRCLWMLATVQAADAVHDGLRVLELASLS